MKNSAAQASLILTLLLGAADAEAADHYVRAGASGAANGSDWTNACVALPATLTRGDTYYIADGSYGGRTFSDPVSGALVISIRKATVAEHGTSVGWDNTYGDGQAVFGPLSINSANSGYYELDGQFAYGFKIDFSMGQHGFNFTRGAPNMVFRYIDFDGVVGTGDIDFTSSTKAINIAPWNGSSYDNTSGLIVSHCAIHGSETQIQWESGDNGIVEYSDFYDNRSINANFHSNQMFIGGGNNNTIRFNRFHNHNVEGLFFTYGGQNNWTISGNVFYGGGSSVARGVELRQAFSYGAFFIYNNTCVDMPLACINNIADSTSGGAGRNNIQSNSGGFSWGAMPNSNNSSVSNSVFLNYAARDFHLATPTAAGAVVAAPNNLDPDGKTRGADGVWDQGAYEFGVGDTTAPAAPWNLVVQ